MFNQIRPGSKTVLATVTILVQLDEDTQLSDCETAACDGISELLAAAMEGSAGFFVDWTYAKVGGVQLSPALTDPPVMRPTESSPEYEEGDLVSYRVND